MGKLVIWGDLSLFERPPHPDSLYPDQPLQARPACGIPHDGDRRRSGEVENTAVLTAHIDYAGQTIDVPMRWRGVGNVPPGIPAPDTTNTWTGAWVVPMDATTGKFSYTVTATDSLWKNGELPSVLVRELAADNRGMRHQGHLKVALYDLVGSSYD
jgi:hypothetical protein